VNAEELQRLAEHLIGNAIADISRMTIRESLPDGLSQDERRAATDAIDFLITNGDGQMTFPALPISKEA
jgi:hypothetical protein